ncbi:unnamed protein product [Boreogadus saida]
MHHSTPDGQRGCMMRRRRTYSGNEERGRPSTVTIPKQKLLLVPASSLGADVSSSSEQARCGVSFSLPGKMGRRAAPDGVFRSALNRPSDTLRMIMAPRVPHVGEIMNGEQARGCEGSVITSDKG